MVIGARVGRGAFVVEDNVLRLLIVKKAAVVALAAAGLVEVEALGVEQLGRAYRSTGGSNAGRTQLLLPWLLLNVNALLDRLLARNKRAKRRSADAEVCLGAGRVVCVPRLLHLERHCGLGEVGGGAIGRPLDNFFGRFGPKKNRNKLEISTPRLPLDATAQARASWASTYRVSATATATAATAAASAAADGRRCLGLPRCRRQKRQ